MARRQLQKQLEVATDRLVEEIACLLRESTIDDLIEATSAVTPTATGLSHAEARQGPVPAPVQPTSAPEDGPRPAHVLDAGQELAVDSADVVAVEVVVVEEVEAGAAAPTTTTLSSPTAPSGSPDTQHQRPPRPRRRRRGEMMEPSVTWRGRGSRSNGEAKPSTDDAKVAAEALFSLTNNAKRR